MKKSILTFVAVFAFAGGLFAGDAKPLLAEDFNRAELGKGWHVNNGNWRIVDGAMRISEIKADKHAASGRRALVTQDAEYSMRFRFIGEGKIFHFGFDPARGELKKKGHLYSVIIKPDSWSIMKHVDKNDRKGDPNEVLAHGKIKIKPGEWHALTVIGEGNDVTAKIKGVGELKATHKTFHVKKPTLVFRCVGDGVEVDDIMVKKL